MLRRSIVVLLAAFSFACTKDLTQIIVAVDSDFAVPAELDRVEAVVFGDDGAPVSSHDFSLPSEVGIPFSFGVQHDGSSSMTLSLEMRARRGTETLFTRRAIAKFVEGKTLLLFLFLSKSCVTVSCALGSSCSENGCVPDVFEVLPEIEPGKETTYRPDGGAGDGGPERAMIIVEPLSGLETDENGATATFTVRLDRLPQSYVAIPISSSDAEEGIPDTTMLTFTPLDWETPKTVVVTGVDDALADGDQPFSIVLAPALSGGELFQGVDAPDVQVINRDNDQPELRLVGSEGLSTTERGGTATFYLELAAEPAAEVVLDISSNNPAEGTVLTPRIAIMPASWTERVAITVEGADDMMADGAQTFDVSIDPSSSADPAYASLPPATVTVTNADDETAGITVSPSQGLVTTEGGGTAEFTIVLNTAPTSAVRIMLSSELESEGTIAPAQVVFDGTSWFTPQTVTITGADDRIDDGDRSFAIRGMVQTTDPEYAATPFADVPVTNLDDDHAGISVIDAGGLVTSEGGLSASFRVVLDSEPTAEVTIELSSSNEAEGTIDVGTLSFDASNWNLPQAVTVTGVEDMAQDGDVGYAIITAPAISNDPQYAGIDAEDAPVINADNDSAGITVSPRMMETSESGITAQFSVLLNTQPSAEVRIPLMSSNTAEVTVSTPELLFTTADWDVPQIVTVSGADDAVDDPDVMVDILIGPAASMDPAYSGFDPLDVLVLNRDDDTANIIVAPVGGLVTTEAGGTATFTIVLGSRPTANVTIPLLTSNAAEGTVAPMSITFTPDEWSVARTITVTGVDDAVDDGDIAFSAVTGGSMSADPAYNARNPPNVSVVNSDNDTAGFEITVAGSLQTHEVGPPAVLNVRLTSQPTSGVLLHLSAPAAEVTVMPGMLTFDAMNWSTVQAVSVTGVDDNVLDGDFTFTLVTEPAISADPSYSMLDHDDLIGSNVDNGTLPSTAITNVLISQNIYPAISADGMTIAFQSNDTGLVPGDGNGADDIFVFDRHTLSTTRISVSSAGAEGNGASAKPAISANGRFVAFESLAGNFHAADSNGSLDVFVHDRDTGQTSLVNIESSGLPRGQAASDAAISSDGRFVVFVSPGGDASDCVFVYDRLNPLLGAVGSGGGDNCMHPSISTDGRWLLYQVGFEGARQLRRVDRVMGMSVRPEPALFDEAFEPAVTPDGRFLSFSGIDAFGPAGPFQVYFLDLDNVAAVPELISVGPTFAEADADCRWSFVSDNGTMVGFISSATNLGSRAGDDSLYVRSRIISSTSHYASAVMHPQISGDGRFLTFVDAAGFTGAAVVRLMSR